MCGSGYALPSKAPSNVGAAPRTRGTAPNFNGPLAAGHSRRLISDGKAVARESPKENKKLPVCFAEVAPRQIDQGITNYFGYTFTYFSSDARRFSIDVRNSSGVVERPCTA